MLCNCPADKADSIATTLVEERYAACVNIVPSVKSVYYWEGKLCKDEECTLLIKIRDEAFPDVEKRIKQIHPYEIPEIVQLNVSAVNRAYLEWVEISTRRS